MHVKLLPLCLIYIKDSVNSIKDDVDEVGEQKEERKWWEKEKNSFVFSVSGPFPRFWHLVRLYACLLNE